jgi:hypothetical protein
MFGSDLIRRRELLTLVHMATTSGTLKSRATQGQSSRMQILNRRSLRLKPALQLLSLIAWPEPFVGNDQILLDEWRSKMARIRRDKKRR